MSAVTVTDLLVRDRENAVVLDVPALQFSPGSLTLVTGPNGAGKSTLALCCAGLLEAADRCTATGRVEIDGLDVLGAPVAERARRVATVLQDPAAQMCTTDVAAEARLSCEHLLVPFDEARRRGRRALDTVGLDARLDSRDPGRLSAGQQQRVALAAALAQGSGVLVLDEPIARLDRETGRSFLATLRGLCDAGATAIVVDHATERYRGLADRTIGLDRGTIVADDVGLSAARTPSPVAAAPADTGRVPDLTVELQARADLRRVSFRAPGGSVIAVVGRNGVGKSSLLQVLARERRPVAGRARLGSRRLRPSEVAYAGERTGDACFTTSIGGDFALAGIDSTTAVEAALHRAALASDPQAHPLAMSAGLRQRLAVCLAVEQRRPLLLLDEPTSAQDPEGRAAIEGLLLGRADSTVLLATHDEDLIASVATHVLDLGSDRPAVRAA